MQEITSLQNPRVQHIKKLKDKSYRRQYLQYVVEGENLVKDLPEFVLVKEVYVLKSRLDEYRYILKKYLEDKVFVVDEKVMKALSETVSPSGILVLLDMQTNPLDLSGNIVVLDGISDPGNMGTIIRTSVACGVKQIIAVNCVDYTSGKVIRASMGGIFKVNITELDYDDALRYLENHTIYALDMNGENIFKMSHIDRPFALVVGSESRGLSEVFRHNSHIVSLPMIGDIESLNAGVSLSAALYYFVFGRV